MSSCKNCGHKPPSALTKVTNYTKAVIKHVVNGLEHTPYEVQEERRSFCRQCPFRDDNSIELICTHKKCGCFVDSKVMWGSEECPIGLWGKYTNPKDLNENTP